MRKYAQVLHGVLHWKGEYETLPEFSPDIVMVDITEIMPEPEIGWQFVDGVFIAPPGKTIEELRAEAWARIKAKRDADETAGFMFMEKLLDSDHVSVQRISIAVQAAQAAVSAGQPFVLDWTTADGSVLEGLTAEQLITMPVYLAQHANFLHQKARAFGEQIKLARTEQEIKAIEAQW